MLAGLGISGGHLSPEDDVRRIRAQGAGAAARLDRHLDDLRAFHADRLTLLERKQQAFVRLLEHAGGEAL